MNLDYAAISVYGALIVLILAVSHKAVCVLADVCLWGG